MNLPIKISIALVGLIILGGILLAIKSKQNYAKSTFVPNPQNDKPTFNVEVQQGMKKRLQVVF
jgi:hypothetical protein